jgi:exopolysaccharide biosynthesis polyprenyl glycosylphosphotransferase
MLVISPEIFQFMIPSHFGNIWGIFGVMAGLLVVWTIFGVIRRFRSRHFSLASKIGPPLSRYGGLADAATKTLELHRKRAHKPHRNEPHGNRKGKPAFKAKQYSRESLENILSMTAIAGDFAMIVLGFVLANLLCQSSLIPASIQTLPMPSLSKSYNLIVAGSVIVLWRLVGKELYHYRSLLFPSKIWHKIIEPFAFCLLAFIGINLVVRIDPPVPWIFFVCAVFLIFLNIYNWRLLLSQIIQHPALSSRLRRRLVVIGGGSQTMRIQKALGENSDMEFIGWVQANKPNHIAELEEFRLGSLHELGSILQSNAINVAVLTESESLQREGVLAVAKACENEHVQFKMVPHFFEILLTGLRPDRVGGIQLLGVDSLPLSGYRNRFAKRTIDIVGALVGLTLSAPLIVIFGALVYWESPGPVLYKQVRQGRNGRLFHILKIRSMHVNAEAHGKAQWAQQNDQRRLRIGAFMRNWNIDEVPQFWNVLIGQMSLVGPRPERPELIARFKFKIPHYQARHMCRPGITGWAQVNGWRGNTDLQERIRHDIWYLENWNLWLDFRIMAQTFFRRDNAY